MRVVSRKLLTAIGLILAILIPVNWFVYSWTGLIFCHYKSIMMSAADGSSLKLNHLYDLDSIASAMKAKPGYAVSDGPYSRRLTVSRAFDGVVYNLTLENLGGATEFGVSSYNYVDYPADAVAKCTTPDYYIERRLRGMIDDLPLKHEHGTQLKSNVRVARSVTGFLLMCL